MPKQRSSHASIFTVGIVLLLAPPTWQQHHRESIGPPHQSITEDLWDGATFTFRNMDPNLPPFTFKIIPERREDDQFGNAKSTVREIEVFVGDSVQPLQQMTGCDSIEGQPPAKGTDWFRAIDLNFDGFEDIYMVTSWGATGNESGCVWLYNPATHRFEYNKAFSELPDPGAEPSTKTIITFVKGGSAGTEHVVTRYAVENNQPVRIYLERQLWDNEKKQFHCVIQKGRAGIMTTVEDIWDPVGAEACNGSATTDFP